MKSIHDWLLSHGKQLTIALLLFGLFHHSAILAARLKGPNQTFPYGCRMMGYSYADNLLTIKPAYDPAPAPQQTMYLIHNKSNRAVQVKAKKSPGEAYKPDHDNVINANQWAAFAMDQDQVQFVCTAAGDRQDNNAINCEQVFEVCQYNHAKFSESTMGSYWVVKTDTLENAVYGAIHIGILLRW